MSPQLNPDRLVTRREWLSMQAIMAGAPWQLVTEAVSSVAIEHPEWDMDEERTWKEWQQT